MRFNKALIVEDQEVAPTTGTEWYVGDFHCGTRSCSGNYHYIMDYLEAMVQELRILEFRVDYKFQRSEITFQERVV